MRYGIHRLLHRHLVFETLVMRRRSFTPQDFGALRDGNIEAEGVYIAIADSSWPRSLDMEKPGGGRHV